MTSLSLQLRWKRTDQCTVRSFFDWVRCTQHLRRDPALEMQLDTVDQKGKTRFGDLELAQRLIFSVARWRFGRLRTLAGKIAAARGTSLTHQFCRISKRLRFAFAIGIASAAEHAG
jgi:hypothetical protein